MAGEAGTGGSYPGPGQRPYAIISPMRPRLKRLQRALGRTPLAVGPLAPPSGGSNGDTDAYAELAAIDQRDSDLVRRLLAWSLAPDSCCIDIGAHAGSVLREILRAAPDGRHIAYEPLPHLAEHLRAEFPRWMCGARPCPTTRVRRPSAMSGPLSMEWACVSTAAR